jgi:hypothetical protein
MLPSPAAEPIAQSKRGYATASATLEMIARHVFWELSETVFQNVDSSLVVPSHIKRDSKVTVCLAILGIDLHGAGQVFDSFRTGAGSHPCNTQMEFPADSISLLGRGESSGDDALGVHFQGIGERLKAWADSEESSKNSFPILLALPSVFCVTARVT